MQVRHGVAQLLSPISAPLFFFKIAHDKLLLLYHVFWDFSIVSAKKNEQFRSFFQNARYFLVYRIKTCFLFRRQRIHDGYGQ